MGSQFTRVVVAILAVFSLLRAPVFAQDQNASDQTAQGQSSAQPSAQATPAGAVPPRTVDLKLDYSVGEEVVSGPHQSIHADET